MVEAALITAFQVAPDSSEVSYQGTTTWGKFRETEDKVILEGAKSYDYLSEKALTFVASTLPAVKVNQTMTVDGVSYKIKAHFKTTRYITKVVLI